MKIWLVSSIVLVTNSTAVARSLNYPPVAPLHEIVKISNVSKGAKIVVKSTTGLPIYVIECHSSSYADDSAFDYSGDFECKMSDVNKKSTYSTLFTDDLKQSRDWQSRARFFVQSVVGDCARIPEFGSKRNFRLRGMRVNLHVLNPIVRSNKLLALTLDVSVAPDRAAHRPIAERIPIPRYSPPHCRIKEYF